MATISSKEKRELLQKWVSVRDKEVIEAAVLILDMGGSSTLTDVFDSNKAHAIKEKFRNAVEDAGDAWGAFPVRNFVGDATALFFWRLGHAIGAAGDILARTAQVRASLGHDILTRLGEQGARGFRIGGHKGEFTFSREPGCCTGRVLDLTGHLLKQCPAPGFLITHGLYYEHLTQAERELFSPDGPNAEHVGVMIGTAQWRLDGTAPKSTGDARDDLKIKLATASELVASTRGTTGPVTRNVLERAVCLFGEVLGDLSIDAAPNDYAVAQNNLGVALVDQARKLTGVTRASKLNEAVAAFGEALRVYTLESAPLDYAATQNNLGNVLNDQAYQLIGEARMRKLEEAVDAYREALRVLKMDAGPTYAFIQNNLGAVLRDQADGLVGEACAQKLEEAVAAYHEALRVHTLDAADNATFQHNLGVTLRAHAHHLTGEVRADELEEAAAAFREALRINTLGAAPDHYATAQCNLGNVLENQAYLLTGETRERKLEEAVAAYRAALGVHTLEDAPRDYAAAWTNLGIAFHSQADGFVGEARELKLQEAVAAYREALRVPTLDPASSATIQHCLDDALNALGRHLDGSGPQA